MDQFFAKVLLLNELSLIGLICLLIVIGGIAGALFVPIGFALRRVSYVGFLAVASVLFMLSQIGWIYIPDAATNGWFSGLMIALLSTFVLLGMAIYIGSAARSIHIQGDTKRAWLGFVPLAILYLVFARGRAAFLDDLPDRSTFERFVLDPVLVIAAAGLLFLGQSIGATMQQDQSNWASDSPALVELIAKARR